MTAGAHRSGESRPVAARARRHRLIPEKLRYRLSLIILVLVGSIGASFAWMAYREVEEALLAQGTMRLTRAGEEVSALLAQSAKSRSADVTLWAAALGGYGTLRHAPDYARHAPEEVLAAFRGMPTARAWLYDEHRQPLGALVAGSGTAAVPPVTGSGVGPLRVNDQRVSYTVSAPIPDANGSTGGFLGVEWTLGSSSTNGLIERLIGFDARIKLGNGTSGIWTDLARPVDAPPIGVPGAPARFRSSDGEARVGIGTAVAGTPWVVWTEASEADLLEPAAMLLRRMIPITLLITLLGGLVVYAVSARITAPLVEASDAAAALAAGDLARRVPTGGDDEIGRLSNAFNMMAARLNESRDALEERIRRRTFELEQARQELDRFFEISLDLLCIAGTDGRFRRVNPAWQAVLGWTLDELNGAPYLDFVHPDDRAATMAENAKLVAGTATVSFENRYRTKDGSYRWLSWKAAPLPAAQRVYAAARDITDLKEASAQLQRHATQLASTNEELEAFSYSVSHDLRAPLRSIDGFAQALVEDYSAAIDGTGRDFLARIRAAAQRMGILIDDLLSLSRVNRVPLQVSAVDLSAMAEDVLARLRAEAADRRVACEVVPNLRTRADPRLLRVALENLLGNAWKFTSRQPAARIHVGPATAPDGTPGFVVRDNGAGFDMAHAGKLFGAFQRLHAATEFPGTGVGLATVQRIVRRHGGTVWAESAPTQGASFYFTLGEGRIP